MPHLVRWHDELSDYSLVVIGPHAQGGNKEEVKAKAASMGMTFPVVANAFVRGGQDFRGLPHVMLFDHTGKCVFRGSPDDVEKELRLAVGKAMVAGIDKPSKSTAPLVDALARGQSPALVLPRVLLLLKAKDAQTADEANKLVENLTAVARKRLEAAEAVKGDDPATAYVTAARVAYVFKGTPVATKATEMVNELKKDKAVQAELKAQPSLDALRKMDAYLTQVAEKSKVDVKDANFLKANAASIDQMKRTLQQLNKSYPDTKASQQAAAIGEKYGISVK